MTTARTTLKSSSIHGTGMFDDRAPPSIPHPPPLATPHEGRMVLAGDGLWYPSADEPIILHDQRRGPDEACAAVEQIDPRLGPALLGELGHRIGERALEPHELEPIDRQLSRPDSFPGQVLYRVNGFGRAHQDLLGIAAPQRARSAEGT